MTDFVECEQLTGRLKTICRGESNLPLNGENSTNAYRSLYGLPPLTLKETVRQVVSTNPAIPKIVHVGGSVVSKPTRWVGTNLALLLKKFGVEVVTGCGGCDQWMNDMNVWGPQGCRERFAEIKERLNTKASELQANAGRVKIFKIGLSMIIKAQWPSIDSLIKKAIKQAEKATQ